MKQRSVFRILGLIAIMISLFAVSKFKPADTSPGDPSATLRAPPLKVASIAVENNRLVQAIDSNAIIIKKQKEEIKAVAATKATKKESKPVPLHKGFDSEKVTRSCITDYWDSQVGVREKTNNNDGKAVFSYFRNVGWKHPENLKPKERFYCGAFMGSSWLHCMESVPFVKSSLQLASVRFWEKGPAVAQAEAKPGDVVSLKGYSHVQGVYERHPNPTFPYYTTVTGNSSASPDDADQRGGVFKRDALWRDVKRVISVGKTLSIHS